MHAVERLKATPNCKQQGNATSCMRSRLPNHGRRGYHARPTSVLWAVRCSVLQHSTASQCLGLPATGTGDHVVAKPAILLRCAPRSGRLGRGTRRGPTFALDQSIGAGQPLGQFWVTGGTRALQGLASRGMDMVKTGRKNAAGGWVLGEFLQRIGSGWHAVHGRGGYRFGIPDSGLTGIRWVGGKPHVRGDTGRDDPSVRRLLRVLPPARCDVGPGSGSGAPNRRFHRTCRGANAAVGSRTM